ncbi:MAG: hypothetical protein N3D82_04990 [Ignisphaera sp.]|nr:hypothetical protein [Ignisphaera sp.]MCX8168363.1 hypothetical protein [Ignisphaera sp.]MDW8086204.1 hypothetical protein [Ignisphaera sp.]
MLMCIDTQLNYVGSKIRVTIYTTSSTICEDVKKFIEGGRWQMDGLLKAVEAHGGCLIKLEKPLEMMTNDGAVKIVAEPKSVFIDLYWGSVVDRLRNVCH